MKLPDFIHHNRTRIQAGWQARAFDLLVQEGSGSLVLQAHMAALLEAIAEDLHESDKNQSFPGEQVASLVRAALRDLAGGGLRQIGQELRVLRGTISDLWCDSSESASASASALQELTRFHSVIDGALCEYLAHYSDEVTRARDGFLSILGHDLRGPLSAITIAGDYLAMPGMLEGKPLQAVLGIKHSASSMSAMIRNLIAYAKARLGKRMNLTPERSDISNICEAAVMRARTLYPDYRFQVQAPTKIYGEVDPVRLQQVLDNLVEGAVQQGANGRPITLAAYEDTDGIMLEVETCGEPMALDALQLIVDPAVQIPFDAAEPDGKLAGVVGLGLFAAREIVLAHGGSITVERAGHGGTLFAVHLPHPSGQVEKNESERRWRFA
jgi:signal transduction histidine kinase